MCFEAEVGVCQHDELKDALNSLQSTYHRLANLTLVMVSFHFMEVQ